VVALTTAEVGRDPRSHPCDPAGAVVGLLRAVAAILACWCDSQGRGRLRARRAHHGSRQRSVVRTARDHPSKRWQPSTDYSARLPTGADHRSLTTAEGQRRVSACAPNPEATKLCWVRMGAAGAADPRPSSSRSCEPR
jgi:hypothetical protein